MSIAFSCTACDAPLTARDKLAGRRLRCTNCGSSNVVPELDDPDTSEESGGAKSAPRNAGVVAFYRILIVGSLLIVALTVVTATLLIASSAPVLPAEEVLVGGVKTTTGFIRQSDRVKDPGPLLGKVHKVTFKKEQSYVIDQESTEMDSFLFLVDANGRIVAQDDDGGGNFNARIIYRPLEAGEFRIIATSLNKQQTGSYKLTIREDDGKAMLVQAPMVQPRFPAPQLRPQPVVPQPFFPHQLPQQRLPTTPKKLVDGKIEVSDTLQIADGFEDRLNVRAIGKAYEIELRGDRIYSIDMKSRQFDSYLMILDAGVNVLAVDDDSGGNLNAHLVFTPPAAGKYRVLCTSFTKNETGLFELIVVEMPRVAGVLPGQPRGLPQPPFAQRQQFRAPPMPVELAEGKFEAKDRILIADRLGNVGSDFGKVYEMDMTAEVTYRIELEFDTPGKGLTKLPRITVQSVVDNPAISQSKSSTGKLVEMSFTPTATGRYRIVATSSNGRYLGPFTLRVSEEK